MKDLRKIGHPLFIIALAVLILNDWYLKPVFHNEITGKLSDFAGLFAFPFLLSTLMPSKKSILHVVTGLLFIFWKSVYAETFIDNANTIGLPISRTIDFSDNIALLSIPISYLCLQNNFTVVTNTFFQKTLVLIACLSFMATSMPPAKRVEFVDINKEYEFPYSKRELIARLNMVQIKEIEKLKTLKSQVDFDSGTNSFHFRGNGDTLAVLLDSKNVAGDDTITVKTSFAELNITGNEKSSKLILLRVSKTILLFKNKDYRARAIKEFEKRIVKGIKSI